MTNPRKSSQRKTGHKTESWLARKRKLAALQRANATTQKRREKELRKTRRKQEAAAAKKSKQMEREFFRALKPNEKKVALVIKDFLAEEKEKQLVIVSTTSAEGLPPRKIDVYRASLSYYANLVVVNRVFHSLTGKEYFDASEVKKVKALLDDFWAASNPSIELQLIENIEIKLRERLKKAGLII